MGSSDPPTSERASLISAESSSRQMPMNRSPSISMRRTPARLRMLKADAKSKLLLDGPCAIDSESETTTGKYSDLQESGIWSDDLAHVAMKSCMNTDPREKYLGQRGHMGQV